MIVVDASVALKWVLPEADSQKALALRGRGVSFAAPSLIVEEIGNVAWQRARRGELTRSQAVAVLRVATSLVTLILPAQEFAETALGLALDLDHPIYDCFYLALAAREAAPLVTADRKLAGLASRAGIKVELLSMMD